MISLQKTGNTIKFTFDDNGRYLYNGTIEVPVNSLTLVTDGSDMFTFKKSATNDIFVSGLYSEIGMTKSELETFYKDNMVDSFINADEAQSMIDESISGKADYSAATFVNEDETETIDYAETGTLYKSFDYDDGVYYFSGRTLYTWDFFLALTVTLNDSATGTPISVTLNTATGETDAYIFYKKSDSKELAVTAKGNYRIVGVSFQTDSYHDVVYTYKTKVAEEVAASTAIKDVIYPELESLATNKLDASAYTPVTIDSAITSGSTNAVQSSAIFDKVTINVEESGSTSGTALAGVYSFNYSDGVYYFNAGSKERENFCNLSEIKYKSGADGEEKTISSTGETDDYIYSSNFYSGTITMKGNNHLTNVNVQGDGIGYSYRYYYNSLVPQWLKDYVSALEARVTALEQQNNT